MTVQKAGMVERMIEQIEQEEWTYADLLDDVSVGDWVAEHIPRFGRTVAGLVPAVFPAYLRVLHPAWSNSADGGDETPVRWWVIADVLGAVMHRTVAWGAMIEAGVRSGQGTGEGILWDSCPTAGDMPVIEIEAVATVLAEHTTTPGSCYFGFWDGLGMTGFPMDQPRLSLPSREHLLVHGTVGDAGRFLQCFSPNIWWPADRAWFVATDVDLMSTYIGGTAAMAGALRSAGDFFEAIDTGPDAKITWDCDTVNPQPEGPYTYG